MANDHDDSEVGYGRPPRGTQFRKGASGNPRGRPRGANSFKTDLAAELREKLTVTENGKERRITKQRAFTKTLVAAAIKKDIRAVTALLACMRYFGVGHEEQRADTGEIEDLDILENYLKRERNRQTVAKTAKPKSRKVKQS